MVLNENYLATMLNQLPKKMRDPWSLKLPCQFGNLATTHALADLGASVNLMPYSFFQENESSGAKTNLHGNPPSQ